MLLPDASIESRLERLVSHAVLAPSTRNTQPWSFVIAGNTIEMFADRARSLPTVDEEGRELIISCGAALFHLRLAARHFRESIELRIRPDADRPDLLARITLAGRGGHAGDGAHGGDATVERLVSAIPYRHTQRRDFIPRIVPAAVSERLRDAVGDEGAFLLDLGATSMRDLVADLVSEGTRRQGANRFYRDEVGAWTVPSGTSRKDGIPEEELALAGPLARLRRTIFGPLSWGPIQARRDRALTRRAPLLMLLATERDDPRAWLDVGQSVGRMLLTATSEGLSASFLNAPLQLPDLRWRLRDTLYTELYPQLILRLGYSVLAPGTPRRPLEEVISTR